MMAMSLLLLLLLVVPLVSSNCLKDGPFGIKPTRNNTFTIEPDSSLLDYLDPSLFEDPFIFEDLGRTLQKGGLVVIKDAFIPEFAELVWEEMNNLQWEPFVSRNRNGHNMMKHKISQSSIVLNKTEAIFDHPKSKRFISELSGRNCSGPSTGVSTLYKAGDHSNPHNDVARERSITYLWQLAKNWDPRWGGAFYWNHAQHYVNGYQHASFNTLLLFPVTTNSSHGVTPVTNDAKEKRFTFGGWFNAPLGVVGENGTRISLDLPIEEWYATEDDRKRLTINDANTIVDLNLDSVEDFERKRKLQRLQDIIMDEVIAPKVEESVYILESF